MICAKKVGGGDEIAIFNLRSPPRLGSAHSAILVICAKKVGGGDEIAIFIFSRAAQVSGAKQVVPQLSGANGFCGRFRVPMVLAYIMVFIRI